MQQGLATSNPLRSPSVWCRRRIGLLLSYATTRVSTLQVIYSDPFNCCSPFIVSGLEPDWMNGAYSFSLHHAYENVSVYESDKNDDSHMYNIDFGWFDQPSTNNGVKGWAFNPGTGSNTALYIKCISNGAEVDCPCPTDIEEFRNLTNPLGAWNEAPPLSVGANGVAISCDAPASNVDGDPHLSLAHGGTADEHVRSVPTRVHAVVAHSSLPPGTYVAQRTHTRSAQGWPL